MNNYFPLVNLPGMDRIYTNTTGLCVGAEMSLALPRSLDNGSRDELTDKAGDIALHHTYMALYANPFRVAVWSRRPQSSSLYGWAMHQLRDRAPLPLPREIAGLIQVTASLWRRRVRTLAWEEQRWELWTPVCTWACAFDWGAHLSKLGVSCQGGPKNRTVVTFNLRERVIPRVGTRANKGQRWKCL